MSSYWITQRRPDPVRRPWRFERRLDLFAALPERHSAAAMDDTRAAEELIDDLIALVDAGAVAPVETDGEVRYAPTDPDDVDTP